MDLLLAKVASADHSYTVTAGLRRFCTRSWRIGALIGSANSLLEIALGRRRMLIVDQEPWSIFMICCFSLRRRRRLQAGTLCTRASTIAGSDVGSCSSVAAGRNESIW